MLSLPASQRWKQPLYMLLWLIALIGFMKVGARAWFETWGSFHSDAAIYMTVARGMLHGLTPYIDLFENKTPGVFTLGAISILLSGGAGLLSWLQGVVIFLFPLTVALPVYLRRGRSMDVATLLTYREWRQWAPPRENAAALLDRVMDRCGIGRYFVFIDRPDGFYGFPHHLPYGPIFTQYSRFIGAHADYIGPFTDAIQHADIMVRRTWEEGVPVDQETLRYLQQNFSETPRPCAGRFEQPLPYVLLFRTQ